MDVILNFSGVYEEEGWSSPSAVTLDFRHLDGCRCYCDGTAEETLRKALAQYPESGIHWIDTGDYHYISKLWMEKIDRPFVLALFDNHPDDQEPAFGEILSCGGWVRSARETLPMMRRDCLNTGDIPGNLPVYLSIDIDILSPDFARTDWSQGNWKLEQLLSAIRRIAENHIILGADVCGGLTSAKGACAADLSINTDTRNVLVDFLHSLFS